MVGETVALGEPHMTRLDIEHWPGETVLNLGEHIQLVHYQGKRWGLWRDRGRYWRCWVIGPLWIFWWGS